ncbi:hypothetical protein OROMI_032550 [Orobanche minor]
MDGEGVDDRRRGEWLEHIYLPLTPPRVRCLVVLISIALLFPLFIEEGGLFDGEHIKATSFFEISSPEQLEKLEP